MPTRWRLGNESWRLGSRASRVWGRQAPRHRDSERRMPIYEYACAGCGNDFEVEQRITDPPLKSCPSCRSRKVKRLISQTSFVLKGGGWHADLYSSERGKNKAAPAAGTEESSKPAAASSDSKSESKPKGKDKDKQKGAKAAA